MKELLYLKDEQLKEFIEKISMSYRETFSDAKKILDTKMSLIGNISTQETLLHGNKDDVHRECLTAIHSGINVLAPSCGFAPHTPLGNIKEMINTVIGNHQTTGPFLSQ